MKNIKSYMPKKYLNHQYLKVANGIYQVNDVFVTSLSFEQESEFDEEINEISQYPLEDILNKYYVYITDFYDELNLNDGKIWYLEFASNSLADIENFRKIIGKHIYNAVELIDGKEYVKLIIE